MIRAETQSDDCFSTLSRMETQLSDCVSTLEMVEMQLSYCISTISRAEMQLSDCVSDTLRVETQSDTYILKNGIYEGTPHHSVELAQSEHFFVLNLTKGLYIYLYYT